MPVWHKATKEARESGKLVVVGITQEQHPDRCRLFAQWHGIDWPILWDPFNVTGSMVVPNFHLVDERGVVLVRRAKTSDLAAFLERPVPPGTGKASSSKPFLYVPEGASKAEQAGFATLSRALWKRDSADLAPLDALAGSDPAWRFRKGVLLRMRHDSKARQPGDFQASIDAWRAALAENPRQYIWRRRIQQYGPRLDKPYPFYNWMAKARAAIKAKGGTPIATPVPLSLAESLSPSDEVRDTDKQPDPEGKLKDAGDDFHITAVVVPHTDTRKGVTRVHVQLDVDEEADATLDLESGRPLLWIAGRGYAARTPTSRGPVTFEFDVATPEDASGPTKGYAVFWICSKQDGTCKFVRIDVDLSVSASTK